MRAPPKEQRTYASLVGSASIDRSRLRGSAPWPNASTTAAAAAVFAITKTERVRDHQWVRLCGALGLDFAAALLDGGVIETQSTLDSGRGVDDIAHLVSGARVNGLKVVVRLWKRLHLSWRAFAVM